MRVWATLMISCACVVPVLMGILMFSGCGSQPVTYQGQPVTNEAIVTATRTVALAERVLASVPPLLIDAHRRGMVPVSVLQEYVAKGAPAAQAALNAAREALVAYAAEPNLEKGDRIRVALQALQGIVAEASALLVQYTTGGN